MERAALCFSDGHVRVRLKYVARLRQLHQGAILPAPVTALDSPVAYGQEEPEPCPLSGRFNNIRGCYLGLRSGGRAGCARCCRDGRGGQLPLFLESMFIDLGTRNGTRPNSPVGAKPATTPQRGGQLGR